MENKERFEMIRDLDSLGRFVIPKIFRDFLGITDKVKLVEKDGKIFLEGVEEKEEKENQ